MSLAIDLGLTNIDIIQRRATGLEHICMPASNQSILTQVQLALGKVIGPDHTITRAAVTGGQYRNLPDEVGGVSLIKVSEVAAIGRGGLYLSQLEQALVVSAGTGTAMVAAYCTQSAHGQSATHVTGSAVGGGTLLGLGRLLLGTADPLAIDRLALQGDANRVDLTLVEAVGSAVGRLPVNANAVNFGRLGREAVDIAHADLAAGLVRLIGQVIAVVAINAARAESLATIIVTGHLVDLLSVRQVMDEVAGFYGADIRVPPQPGTGTAIGALLCMEESG